MLPQAAMLAQMYSVVPELERPNQVDLTHSRDKVEHFSFLPKIVRYMRAQCPRHFCLSHEMDGYATESKECAAYLRDKAREMCCKQVLLLWVQRVPK